MSLVRAPSPKWFWNDFNGDPLNDTDFASFLSNTFPYLPQAVYHDNQGITPWNQPIPFDSSGGLPIDLYFDPHLVYRVEIRSGPTQNDGIIGLAENFIPGDGSNINPITPDGSTENQVSNPQFAYVNFNNTFTITVAGTYNIAPDWDLILTGTGTTVLTQVKNTGAENLPNNPPFLLTINNSGWTTCFLRQRYTLNGALFASEAVSMSMLARSSGTNQIIFMSYQSNDMANPLPVASGDLVDAQYTIVEGSILLPASVNTTTSPTAYVDMLITLPGTSVIDVSNIQMFPTETPVTLPYQETTVERQFDHLFNYYGPQLIIKPKASILTGWEFGLNPFQFNSATSTVASAQCQYICDQTILYSQFPGNLSVFRNINETTGLQINGVGGAGSGATQFALINYIDPNTMSGYWGNILSSLVRARIYSGVANSQVPIKMRLIYRRSLPPVLSNTDPIETWTGKDPVFAAGWTAIVPNGDPEYTLVNGYLTAEGQTTFPHYAFEGMILPAQTTPNDTLAIVLYTTASMASPSMNPDVIDFQRISLVPNRFAVDSNPLTFDENLRKCQYLYEKSYEWFTLPSTITPNSNGSLTKPMFIYLDPGSGQWKTYLTSFSFPYKQTKFQPPTVNFYSPNSGSQNAIDANLYFNNALENYTSINMAGSTPNYTILINSRDAIELICNNTSSPVTTGTNMTGQESFLRFQYTADARLGVNHP